MPKNGGMALNSIQDLGKRITERLLMALPVSLITRRTRLVGLLNRPQRKPLTRTESGILKVNKINPAIVTSTDQRFVVSKNEGGE
jgi:hypothetical protein